MLQSPFYTLGPLVIDIAPGNDPIQARSRGDSGWHGASTCCSKVTPKEPWLPNAGC